MILPYDKLMSRVPERTKEFIKNMLTYRDYKYYIDVEEIAYNYNFKQFINLLFTMVEDNEYALLIKTHPCFYNNNISLENKTLYSDDKTKEEYDKKADLFDIYEDELEYSQLLPLDIFLNLVEKIKDYQEINEFLDRYDFNKIINQLQEKNRQEHQEYKEKKENEIFKDLPVDVIFYLETASKIMNRFKVNQERGAKFFSYIQPTLQNIAELSLFLALYSYKGINEEAEALLEILDKKEHNLIEENIAKDIENDPSNIFYIEEFFKPFYECGKTNEIRDILKELVKTSKPVQKLLLGIDCNLKQIDLSKENVSKIQRKILQNKIIEESNQIYQDLDTDTIKFIQFTVKTYSLLLKKMKEEKHNKEILRDEDDADTLALYIANHFYNGDINTYFENHGVTLEKILTLLNINLTKEEICEEPLDIEVLIKRFKRFIKEGVNQDVGGKDINMRTISLNLCQREFNRSIIMEQLFNSISKDIKIYTNFKETLEEEIQKIKEERIIGGLSEEVIDYLKIVTNMHNFIKEKREWTNNDLQVISLFLGLLRQTDDKETSMIYSELGFSMTNTIEYISLGEEFIDKSNSIKDIDIDLLEQYYLPFIFEGKVKGITKENITIEDISKNIFNPQLSQSSFIKKFLKNTGGYTYESFADYEKLKREIQDRKIEKYFRELIKENFSLYKKETLMIHAAIQDQLDKKKCTKGVIKNSDDIVKVSLLLAMYEESTQARFLKKYGLSYEKIMEYLGIHQDLEKTIEVSVLLPIAIEYYKDYFYDKFTSDAIVKIFDSNLNPSPIIENICEHFEVPYDILKIEIENDKDYEELATPEERLELFKKQPVANLNLQDYQSILKFGNTLTPHSSYIFSEFPKAIMNDTNEVAVQNIQTIIKHMKKEEKPAPKSFFKRLFQPKEEESQSLDKESFEKLRPVIEENIQKLSKELLGYQAIRKYIVVYIEKNSRYIEVVTRAIESLNETIEKIDATKEEQYAMYLEETSNKQTLENKLERFQTSNILMRQELMKVHQMMINHSITLNALETARDSFLPLIATELAIAQGRNTENQALEVSTGIIQVFSSLLEGDVEKAQENVEKIREYLASDTTYFLLQKDVEAYNGQIVTLKNQETDPDFLESDQQYLKYLKKI